MLKNSSRGEKVLWPHFFYVKKAYDSVWHARLLYKLKNIGITDDVSIFKKLLIRKMYLYSNR